MDWFGSELTPLAGGYSGETYRVDSGGERLVLRVYGRDPRRCVVDAALLRLLAGVVPVAVVVDERPPAEDEDPGVLVTELLPGERLDLVLAGATASRRATAGRHLGEVLGRLSGIPMAAFGMFTGPELRPSPVGAPTDLRDWVGHFRTDGRLASWRDEDVDALLELVDEAEGRLAGEAPGTAAADATGPDVPRTAYTRHVLVHSDLNPKNVLVDPETLHITGLVDWEFSHAGSPYADLGNVTRFERHPDFVAATLEGLARLAPPLAPDPLTLGRCADLWALVELAGGTRRNATRNPVRNPVRDLAATLLLAQARSGDLHAWPWPTPRVDPADGQPVS